MHAVCHLQDYYWQRRREDLTATLPRPAHAIPTIGFVSEQRGNGYHASFMIGSPQHSFSTGV